MAEVDWSLYLTCPACGVGQGQPCRMLSGYVPGAQGGVVEVPTDEPHGGRKLRAGAVSRG